MSREKVVDLIEKYQLGPCSIDERMMDWLRLFYTYSRIDLESTITEQAARIKQLEDTLRKIAIEAKSVADDHHKPRYTRLDEALVAIDELIGE